MTDWYTPRELAELRLPGLPGSQRKILARAKNEQWVGRERASTGGRKPTEYHISALPEVARIALARKSVDPDAPYRDRREDASYTPCIRGERNRGQARLYVVNLFRSFADAASLQGGHARSAFCHLYNTPTGENDLHIPEWVRDYVYRANVRTLEAWVRKAKRDGIESLKGRYGHRKGSGTIDSQPAIRDFCATQCETRPQLTAAQLTRGIETQFGEKVPKRTVQRWMATFKEENAAHLLSLHDPDKHKSKYQAAFGSMSEGVVALNQLWEIDATPADVMTLEADGSHRRMNITGIIDVYSRRVKVIISPTAKATAASGVLRKAILEWGVPQKLKTDNGQDFLSAHFTRALADLVIEHDPCEPFTPEGKPHIERFFHTMAHDLFSLLPGFIGHNVSERKAIEARRSFAQRFGKNGDKVIDVSMTAEELQAACDLWIETQYERRPHSGLNAASPFETATLWTGGVERVQNERVLDLMLMEAPDKDGIRSVTKKGIRVENTTFIAPDLGPLVGERVHVRLDPCDMGSIHVYSTDGEFICVAEAPERTGADRKAIALQAKKLQREVLLQGRAAARSRAKQYKPHAIVDGMLEDSARKADKVLEFPGASTPHVTPATLAAEANLKSQDAAGEERQLTPEQEEMAARALARLEGDSAEVVNLADAKWANDPPPAGSGYEWVMWAQRHRHDLSEEEAALLRIREGDPAVMRMVKAMSD